MFVLDVEDERLRQRGEQEEVGLARARLHPPCLVLLRLVPALEHPLSGHEIKI